MKLADHVRKSILEYPTLYKSDTYERSRLSVLNHLFLVIGNGYEWAYTMDPARGGYLTDHPNYYKRGDKEGDRKYDKPYGVEKYDREFSPNYFTNRLFHINLLNNRNARIVSVTPVTIGEGGIDDVYIEIEGLVEEIGENEFSFLKTPKLYEANRMSFGDNRPSFSPYPISNYSAIREIYDKNLFVQPDWLEGAVDVGKAALVYYSDSEQYKYDSYYPSPERIKGDEQTFEQRKKSGGDKAVKELRKVWGYKEGQTVAERKWENWNEFHSKSVQFLNDFIKKYDSK
jgi:hypothetical protein